MTSSKRNYNYFAYTLPDEPTEAYINRALLVLRDIKDQFSQFYEHFRCPSEVLTLSGVRAFDTYYELGKKASREEINGLKALLKNHGIMLLEEDFPFGDEASPDNRYSIVHIDALNDIPNRYRHLPEPGWKQPDFTKLKSDLDFFLWWGNWQRNILLVRKLDTTCQTWLANTSWMAHDMTFGILLGYPGEAICSALYQTEEDDRAGRVIGAKITSAHKFDGAHPVYDYLDDVKDSPVITDHQALWSAILEGVYLKLEDPSK